MKGAQFPWMVWMHVLLAHKGKHRSLLLMDKEKKNPNNSIRTKGKN